jgi:hypothetical protein
MMGGGGPDSGVINYGGSEGGNDYGGLSGEEAANLANVQVTGTTTTPETTATTNLNDVITAIVNQQAAPETVQVTEQKIEKEPPKTVEQVIDELVVTGQAQKEAEQEVKSLVAPALDTTIPEIKTTGIREKPSTITGEEKPAPLIVAPPVDTTLPPKTYTTAEIIDMIRLGILGASVLGAGSALTQNNGPTQFDIVPVPEDWRSPTAPKAADFTPLTPIDFGTKDLLKGTQWERLLNPTYGQIPVPVQFNQPTNMSYSDLTRILGGGRDILPSQALSINDVISGIQNQYGQAPKGSMG